MIRTQGKLQLSNFAYENIHSMYAYGFAFVAIVCVICSGCSNRRNIMMNAYEVETTLRQLILTNRDTIEVSAPFVYEEDTFKGGSRMIGSNDWAIGKWIVCKEGKGFKATISRCFGSLPGRYDREVLEAYLVVDDKQAVVKSWKVYQTQGNRTE